MKKSTMIVFGVAAVLLVIFAYPHIVSLYAGLKGRLVTGTANSGNDSGGVLTGDATGSAIGGS